MEQFFLKSWVIFFIFALIFYTNHGVTVDHGRSNFADPSKSTDQVGEKLSHVEEKLENLFLVDFETKKFDTKLEFQFGGETSWKYSGKMVLGNVTTYGKKENVDGSIVKLHPYRACERSSLGLDSTLAGHIVVVMVEEVEPFLAGCVNPYNQAKFAQDSLSLGVILDMQNIGSSNNYAQLVFKPGPENFEKLRIPVVSVNGLQAQTMHAILQKAARNGLQSVVRIVADHPNRIIRQSFNKSSWKDFMPSLFDAGIFMTLLAMLILLFIFILIKINKNSKTKRVVPLHALAKEAILRMETKKFRRPTQQRKFEFLGTVSGVNENLATQKMLTKRPSSVVSCASDVTCAICLENFKEGQIIRVITCGHDFHRNCVDPWLLKNRTCPLCLFDVVLQCHPRSDGLQAQTDTMERPRPPMPLLSSLDHSNFWDVPMGTSPDVRLGNVPLPVKFHRNICPNQADSPLFYDLRQMSAKANLKHLKYGLTSCEKIPSLEPVFPVTIENHLLLRPHSFSSGQFASTNSICCATCVSDSENFSHQLIAGAQHSEGWPENKFEACPSRLCHATESLRVPTYRKSTDNGGSRINLQSLRVDSGCIVRLGVTGVHKTSKTHRTKSDRSFKKFENKAWAYSSPGFHPLQ